jgi:DNA-directed DNA polymerase III PolC
VWHRQRGQWRHQANASIHALVELLADHPGGKSLLGVLIPPQLPSQRFLEAAEGLTRLMPDRLAVALQRTDDPEGVIAAERACLLADALEVPVVATGDVRMHDQARRSLLDTLCAIRHGTSVQQMGARLSRNAEKRLKSPREMLLRFADKPEAVETAYRFLERASAFSLDQLRYEYPDEVVPAGVTPMHYLRELVWKGARERYPRGVPSKVARQFEHEFAIIDDLRYAPYFLTVHDIVAFARSRGILCQGRGAAANSAVCFALGVTAVDPDRIDVLFERFVSRERNEPPDIDIDFEHERREEVIQHIYGKYGRHRAALVSEVISYRGRSAVRDVGKALGLADDVISKLAAGIDRWSGGGLGSREEGFASERDAGGDARTSASQEARHSEVAAQLREAGLDPSAPIALHFVRLVGEIQGFPRHRSQHVGGFVISRGPLAEMVPIENAAMEDRTILEWDKDDIEALGMLKIDILSLGMLTAVRKAIDLVNGDRAALAAGADPNIARDAPRPRADLRQSNAPDLALQRNVSPSPQAFASGTAIASALQPETLRFHTIPAEDRSTYDMICKADTVGVFQIESRAQMSMLPRLKPRSFYDLVIEVAIVRPGPIQGDMVHPYLRRRNGEEPIRYPDEAIRNVLGKTLGVPLFQEQAMSLAVVAAGFTPGQADELRRAIAAWKRSGNQIARFGEALEQGMVARGYSRAFAKQVFEQIKGFSGYGFPESHAASFALLVYASAWLKRHHPAAFAAALLNSQPMGFYAPAQIVRDAQEHGIAVRGVDIHCSRWDSTLERGPDVVARLAEECRHASCEVQTQFAWCAPSTASSAASSMSYFAQDTASKSSARSTFRVEAGVGAMLEAQHQQKHQQKHQQTRVAYSHDVGANAMPDDIMRAKPSIYLLERFRWGGLGEQNEPRPSVEATGTSVRVQRWETMASKVVPREMRDMNAEDAIGFVRAHGRGRSALPTTTFENSTEKFDRPSSLSRLAEPLCPPSGEDHVARLSSDVSFDVPSQPAVRLGLRMVRGLEVDEAQRIVVAVARTGPFRRIADLADAANIGRATLRKLAAADAFTSMGLDRQQAMWQILALRDRARDADGRPAPSLWSTPSDTPRDTSRDTSCDDASSYAKEPIGEGSDIPHEESIPTFSHVAMPQPDEHEPNLPSVHELSAIAQDLESTGVSLKRHPIACLRERLQRARVLPCGFLRDERRTPAGRRITVAGLVLLRQRPSTAKGIVFMTVEDESGIANLIFRPQVYERLRKAVRHAAAICVRGKVERRHGVVHLLVTDARDITRHTYAPP